MSSGFGLFDKSKCADLFDQTKVDGINMYYPRSKGVKLRFKFRKKVLDMQLIKLKFILAIGGLTDIFYIIATLRKYEIIKAMFVLELELGQEVFIPYSLSCDKYPFSFRFYDPII